MARRRSLLRRRGLVLWRRPTLLCLLLLIGGPRLAQGQAALHHAKRSVTVPDIIRMTRLASGPYEAGSPSTGLVPTWSLDHGRFAVVLKRGDLDQNGSQYFLVLFAAGDVSNGRSRPDTLVALTSPSNRPAIDQLKWIANNTIAFIGEESGGRPSVYAVTTETRRLTVLMRWSTNIVDYDVTRDLQEVLFLAERPAEGLVSNMSIREGIVMATELYHVLGDLEGRSSEGDVNCQLFLKSRDGAVRRLGDDVPLWGLRYPWNWWQLSLSPDGGYALLQTEVSDLPSHWVQYTNQHLRTFMRPRQPGPKWMFQYLLVDLHSGAVEPLLDSPNANGNLPKYLWNPDGKSVFLSQVFLPLDVTDSSQLRRREATPFVAEVKLPSREAVPITDESLDLVRWEPQTGRLVMRPDTVAAGQSRTLVQYERRGSAWRQERASVAGAGAGGAFEIRLEEDINTPPRIVALNRATQQSVLLLDLNPQFEDLAFGKVEVVSWKSTDGHEVEGGLYFPPDYVQGERYPLVIQTHGFDPGRFYIDGPFTTAFAAQALAGSGMVVLQIGIDKDAKEQPHPWNPRTASRAMASYEGAVDYLDGRGLIDRARVGLIGFSATCYGVQYTLTHTKYHFAAASITDGIDGGYFQYILTANAYSASADFSDLMHGGPPFGANLSRWLQEAPGFNLDKVQAPVRIEAIGGGFGIVSMWEWLAGLTRLGKPVEMILIRDGVHILQRPWDRMISQGGSLDWFRFWLKGEEDPDPAKAEQYLRWRELRKLQQTPGDTTARVRESEQ